MVEEIPIISLTLNDMRIPKNLRRLKNKKGDALFLVTGKQNAVIYRATRGVLEKIDEFRMTSFQSYEEVRGFMSELVVHLMNIKAETVPSIYLFTPSNVKKQIMKALPTDLRKHIKAVITGNFFNVAPSDLIMKFT